VVFNQFLLFHASTSNVVDACNVAGLIHTFTNLSLKYVGSALVHLPSTWLWSHPVGTLALSWQRGEKRKLFAK
jgi:hypothetical protein